MNNHTISCFSIDRTYKLYINGKQCRPDANYSRPLVNKNSQVIAQVGEANRKDVREAVEAAVKAQPGYSFFFIRNYLNFEPWALYYENMQLRNF